MLIFANCTIFLKALLYYKILCESYGIVYSKSIKLKSQNVEITTWLII